MLSNRRRTLRICSQSRICREHLNNIHGPLQGADSVYLFNHFNLVNRIERAAFLIKMMSNNHKDDELYKIEEESEAYRHEFEEWFKSVEKQLSSDIRRVIEEMTSIPENEDLIQFDTSDSCNPLDSPIPRIASLPEPIRPQKINECYLLDMKLPAIPDLEQPIRPQTVEMRTPHFIFPVDTPFPPSDIPSPQMPPKPQKIDHRQQHSKNIRRNGKTLVNRRARKDKPTQKTTQKKPPRTRKPSDYDPRETHFDTMRKVCSNDDRQMTAGRRLMQIKNNCRRARCVRISRD